MSGMYVCQYMYVTERRDTERERERERARHRRSPKIEPGLSNLIIGIELSWESQLQLPYAQWNSDPMKGAPMEQSCC